MSTPNTSSDILLIVLKGSPIIKKGGVNINLYEEWPNICNSFTYDSCDGSTNNYIPGNSKADCLIITDENKDDYPEYLI